MSRQTAQAIAEHPPAVQDVPRIILAHGGGGELTNRLVRDHVLSRLSNPRLAPLADGALLPACDAPLVFTTDSFVVTPLEFPGGDIGRLAVAGTVNDLAVMGASPMALSLALILEEGLPIAVLDRILDSIARTAAEAGVDIVTGDTKVIERRGGDGLLINTAGIGRLRPEARLGESRIEPGDAILVSGGLAEHGLAVLSVRDGLEFDSDLRSDAAPLADLVAVVLTCGADVKFLRDPTRGGLAGVLADVAERRGLGIEIHEAGLARRPPRGGDAGAGPAHRRQRGQAGLRDRRRRRGPRAASDARASAWPPGGVHRARHRRQAAAGGGRDPRRRAAHPATTVRRRPAEDLLSEYAS
jgi:hydrogenase expression/formation protein HypE